MDVQFDNAQELNSFHMKARGLFKCIDGVRLGLQTIKVEVDSEIVPQLYLKGNSGLRTSWAQMKEHEKCKRTSHH